MFTGDLHLDTGGTGSHKFAKVFGISVPTILEVFRTTDWAASSRAAVAAWLKKYPDDDIHAEMARKLVGQRHRDATLENFMCELCGRTQGSYYDAFCGRGYPRPYTSPSEGDLELRRAVAEGALSE